MIKEKYYIHQKTLAIIPAREITYATIIIEEEQTIQAHQTPLDIMKASCRENCWSTYEGTRKAVMYHMNFTYKVPIPMIIGNHKLYFFPTHSPSNINNIWIAAHQIAFIKKLGPKKSSIQFTSGKEVTIDVSAYTLHEQKNRALACMYKHLTSTGTTL